MRVVTGKSRVARRGGDATSLVVRVAALEASERGRPVKRRSPEARIGLSIADARLRQALTRAMAEAVREAGSRSAPVRVIRVRTRKALARLGERLAGAIALVVVTERTRARLPDFVDAIRAAGVLGVQLVWDGRDPDRSRVERHVFAVLERARATPAGPPVVLATSDEPVETLLLMATA